MSPCHFLLVRQLFVKSQGKQQNNLPRRFSQLRIILFFNFTLHHNCNITTVLAISVLSLTIYLLKMCLLWKNQHNLFHKKTKQIQNFSVVVTGDVWRFVTIFAIQIILWNTKGACLTAIFLLLENRSGILSPFQPRKA